MTFCFWGNLKPIRPVNRMLNPTMQMHDLGEYYEDAKTTQLSIMAVKNLKSMLAEANAVIDTISVHD